MNNAFWYSSGNVQPCATISSYVCDHPLSYAAIVVTGLLLIPFAYLIASNLREMKIKSIFHCIIPASVGYCSSFTAFVVIIIYYFFVFYAERHEEINDLYSNFAAISSDMYLMSLSCYFVHICKILNTLNNPLSKILNLASRILQYFFSASTIVKTILLFVNLQNKWNLFLYSDSGFYYKNIIIPLEYVINVVSFLILSMMVIFSSFQDIFERKKRLALVVDLFLFAFLFCAALILRTYIYSFIVVRYILIDANKYMWIFSTMFFAHRFIVDYVILSITITLSKKENNESQKEGMEENELNMVIIV